VATSTLRSRTVRTVSPPWLTGGEAPSGAGAGGRLLNRLVVDKIVGQRSEGGIEIERVGRTHAPGMQLRAGVVVYRLPGRVFHDLHVDLVPGREAFLRLRRIDDGIGGVGVLLDLLVAVPRPVPRALAQAGAAQDRPVEIRGVGEVGAPRKLAREDH